MQKNQNGFSIVEGLLILVILGALGGVGWYVYQSKQKAKPQDDASSSLEIEEEQEEIQADETATWLLYEPPGKEYTVRLPDGWNLSRHQKDPSLYSFDAATDVTYKKGTPAIVTEVEGGRDFSSTPFALSFNRSSGSPRGSLGKQFKTNQGLDVKQYIFEQTVEPDDLDIPKGATEYRYDLSKGSISVVIVHDVKVDETEQTARVEQLIKTLEIK